MKYLALLLPASVVVLVGVIVFWMTYEPEIGPAIVRIETDDGRMLEDVVVGYFTEVGNFHGYRTIYKDSQVAASGKQVVFEKNKMSRTPSKYTISVCHPLYRCVGKTLMSTEVHDEVNFRTIRLESWASIVNNVDITQASRQDMFHYHLIGLGNRYLPNISYHEVRNRKEYRDYLKKICLEIFDSHYNIDKCEYIPL